MHFYQVVLVSFVNNIDTRETHHAFVERPQEAIALAEQESARTGDDGVVYQCATGASKPRTLFWRCYAKI